MERSLEREQKVGKGPHRIKNDQSRDLNQIELVEDVPNIEPGGMNSRSQNQKRGRNFARGQPTKA